MHKKRILIDNDNLVTLEGLYDPVEGAYINDATVTMTLLDEAGSNASGQTFPAALTYKTGSDGVYEGVLEEDLSLTEGSWYTLEIEVSASNDRKAKFTRFLEAQERIV